MKEGCIIEGEGKRRQEMVRKGKEREWNEREWKVREGKRR